MPVGPRGYSARVDSQEVDFRAIVQALLRNALDQAREGRCGKITVEVSPEVVRVSDDGPGLPVHPHPVSGRPLAEVILTGPRRGPVNTLARVNAHCLWLEVEIHAAGDLWAQRYEFALPGGPLDRRGATSRRGTSIACAPARGARPTLEEVRGFVRDVAAREGAGSVEVRLRELGEPGRDETILLS